MATVEAPVHATESAEKIRRAILSIFPGARLKNDGKTLAGECDLTNFFALAKREQLRSVLLSVAVGNAREGKTFIDLNKVAALAGLLSVDEGSVLGAIRINAQLADFEAGLNTGGQ